MNTKYAIASGITIAAGVIGAMIVDPYVVTQSYSNPGRGLNRSCSPSSLVCGEIRNRELYSGDSFFTNSYVDSERTFQNRLAGGVIAAGIVGAIAFGSIAVASNFSESEISE